jgi:hypothetical protein
MTIEPGAALGRDAPPGLIQALENRAATVRKLQTRAHRRFVIADAPAGRIFARFSTDPSDYEVLAHEAAVRNMLGGNGWLRSPAIIDRGEDWLLEACVEALPARGFAYVDLAVGAAEELARTDLPHHKGASRRLFTLNRRWRTLRSPLPVADLRMARAIRAASPLPAVSSHGDFVPENLLFDGSALWVIDWELSGRRPAGTDLMQLWTMLDAEDDRQRLFDGAVCIVGEDARAALLAVRYATVVAMIAALYAAPNAFDRDPFRAHALLELLPELRKEAGIIR